MKTAGCARQHKGRQMGVTFLLLVAFVFCVLVGPGVAAAEDDTSAAEEAGLGIGSALLTLVYFPVKLTYAVLGGVVGGFTYALTGGDLETANTVWEPSFYGTYVITPAHLKGDEAVRFYGLSPYEEEEPQP